MELNNIPLTAAVVSSLYENVLIDVGEAVPLSSHPAHNVEPTQQVLKKAGNNHRNVLLVANEEESMGDEILPAPQITFITDILKACKLTMDDVTLINKNDYKEHSFKELNSLFPATVVILFGLEPAAFGLPINFPVFQVQTFNGNTFLYSPPLSKLPEDKLLKSKLWVCLKQVFKL